MDEQNKNLILATVLSVLVIVVWSILFPPPEPPVEDLTAQAETTTVAPTTATAPAAAASPAAPETAAAEAPRIAIETPSLTGSLSLLGGRIDELKLKKYRETLDDDSPLVTLLSPLGSENPYYVLQGWVPVSGVTAAQVPGPETLWSVETKGSLTPETPVRLVWNNDNGQVFRREISVDDRYMFHVTQTVENTSDTTVELAPYGLVARHGEPDTVNFFVLHEGVVRMSDGTLNEIDYDDISSLSTDDARLEVQESGWTGFTDKYWMTTLIPDAGLPFRSGARVTGDAYLLETIHPTVTVAPGSTASASERVFAGAKEWEDIRHYQNDEGVAKFIDSIDWGWFFFLTKPIFRLLHSINALIGNMGWAIIGLTLILKAILFPLAYRSYASMAKMRELQPEMEKLKEQAGDDREKLQKGMMELYKTNKVNPAAGCLPILLQIPIFFSLYKVIFVTLELRHAPWIGWIKDLSAPDPSSILNLFGLLPFAVPEPGSFFAILSLGILPILLGISMWLQQKLNPAPPDPTQRMIFAWMPWMFMFMLGSFASGLVLYWIVNNMITFAQQYTIMRSHGYKPDILGNIFGGGDKATEKK